MREATSKASLERMGYIQDAKLHLETMEFKKLWKFKFRLLLDY